MMGFPERTLADEIEMEAPHTEEEIGLSGPQLDAAIDHALERLADFAREKEEIRETARLRMEPIEQWRDVEVGKLDREGDFWRQRVEALTRDYDYGRKKSKRLAFGEFGTRRKPDRVEIVDEAKLLEFARANNVPVKVKESVSKTDLGKLVADGFTPLPDEDGWTVEPGSDEFYYKTI